VKFPRRKFFGLAASVAVLPAVTSAGRAETYPSRPVHWIVSFLAGGANDIVARISLASEPAAPVASTRRQGPRTRRPGPH
jgi:tripartite-type tricarboxylate transporter receptor subunit TctC